MRSREFAAFVQQRLLLGRIAVAEENKYALRDDYDGSIILKPRLMGQSAVRLLFYKQFYNHPGRVVELKKPRNNWFRIIWGRIRRRIR